MRLHDLVQTIQLAIGPVILVSGVGLLLLSMTNRLGRVIDRSRRLSEAVRQSSPEEKGRIVAQLLILSHRARLIRLARSEGMKARFAHVNLIARDWRRLAQFYTKVFG